MCRKTNKKRILSLFLIQTKKNFPYWTRTIKKKNVFWNGWKTLKFLYQIFLFYLFRFKFQPILDFLEFQWQMFRNILCLAIFTEYQFSINVQHIGIISRRILIFSLNISIFFDVTQKTSVVFERVWATIWCMIWCYTLFSIHFFRQAIFFVLKHEKIKKKN